MSPDKPKFTSPDAKQPDIELTSQNARQGRTGKQTLAVLVISLLLAIVAGVVLGLIPLGRA